MSVFFLVDDKHIPVYRIMWIAATPHFCGAPECEQEGDYEIRLEQGESVWASREERFGPNVNLRPVSVQAIGAHRPMHR